MKFHKFTKQRWYVGNLIALFYQMYPWQRFKSCGPTIWPWIFNNKQKCCYYITRIFPLCFDRPPGMVPRQHCMQQCQRKCGMLGVNICLIVRFTTTPGGSAGQRTTRDCVRNSGSPQKPLLLQPICPLQINYHLIYMCTNVHHEYIYLHFNKKNI